MITPNDIEKQQIRRAGKGYAPDEVDDFLDQLTVDYEKLYRTTREQAAQIDTLNQAVAYYQGLEDSLNKALVLAEKTAAERKAAAEERAAQIEQDATRRGEAILADAKGRMVEYRGTYSQGDADLDGGGSIATDRVTNSVNLGVSFSF